MLGDILQPTHLIFILIVALLFLGPKRLPDAGRALGQGLSEFKRSLSGEDQNNPPIIAPPAVPAEDDHGSGGRPR